MITIDGSDLLKAETLLKNIPKGIEKAVKRSVNETAAGTKSDMAKEAAKNYKVKVGDVKKVISVHKGQDGFSAVVSSTGKPLPLSFFNPLPGHVQHRGKRNEPVSVEVKRGKRKRVKGGFIAKMDSGHVGVMKRVWKRRLPIDELYTVSMARMIDDKEVISRIEEKAEERLEKRFTHNVDSILKGYGR